MDDMNTQQAAEETTDAFLEGWGDDQAATEGAADQPETEETENTDSAADSQQAGERTALEQGGNAEATAEPSTATEQGAKSEQEKTPVSWNVKYLGEEKTLTAADITPEFLQKAMDYDRVRAKYDEAKPTMEMISAFAEKAGMSVADYTTFLRTEAKKAGGMTEEEAKRTIALEDREATVSAKEAAQKEAEDAQTAANNAEKRVQAEVADFEKAFPDVFKIVKDDPTAIPQSVWDDFKAGVPLSVAYAKYAVAKAQTDAKTAVENAVTNERNSQRGTGSQKSAGADSKQKDAFLEGWDS